MGFKSGLEIFLKRLIPGFLISWCFSLLLGTVYILHVFLYARGDSGIYWTAYLKYFEESNQKSALVLGIVLGGMLTITLYGVFLAPAVGWALRTSRRNMAVWGSILWALLAGLIFFPPPLDDSYQCYFLAGLSWIGLFAIGFVPFKPKVDSVAPPPLPPTSPAKRVVSILLASFMGLGFYEGGLYFFHLYQKVQYEKDAPKREAREELDKQIQMHLSIQPKLKDIQMNSVSLPPCPLIYPLLNEKGNLTRLGSFLSLCAMRQATFLHPSVFKLESITASFEDFDLISDGSPVKNPYLKQLPYYYGAKDFAQGTLKKTKRGYKIIIRFSGTHPSRKFQKSFPEKKLNRAPVWMARCLDDYLSFKTTPEQARVMALPPFLNGDDLEQAAYYEPYFCEGGTKLVLNWDKLLADNPGDPYLLSNKVDILRAVDYGNYLEMVKPALSKKPNSTFLRQLVISEYNSAKKYDQALEMTFVEIKRDDDNAVNYDNAVYSLEGKGDWIDAYQLLKIWTRKHPEDMVAWLRLGDFMKNWAWNIRGNGMADTVSPEAWPLFEKRITEGYGYVLKALKLSPASWLPWSYALSYGTGADLDGTTMEHYFQECRKLNPYCYGTYSNYLDYLKPKWTGSHADMMDFAALYSDKFPWLMVEAAMEDMGWDPNIMNHKQLDPKTREAYDKSHSWPLFEKNIRLYLTRKPTDLQSWYYYLLYAERAGKLDHVYQLSRKLSAGDPGLKALPLQLILTRINAHYWNLDTNQEKSAYWNGQDRLKETAKIDLEMQKLEPENWYWLNNAICFQMHTGQVAAAVKTYKKIGQAHWDPSICEQSDWETVKKWAVATPTVKPGNSLPHRH